MQTFKLTVGGRRATLRATAVDVALKRFLGGGWNARFKMAVGETIRIVVSREA